MEKIWKIILLLSLVLSLVSIAGVASVNKKINSNQVASFVPAGKTGETASDSVQSDQMAYAFVGYPVTDKVDENSGVKSFFLKGHWVFDKEAKLDYVNKTEEDQSVVVEINGETQIEFLGLKKADKKTTSSQEFKITDLKSPYLVVFKDVVGSSVPKVFAKEIKIYPPIPK